MANVSETQATDGVPTYLGRGDPAGYLTAPNRVISAANGIDYAYRQVGDGTPALVLLQHFRGNLDNWDPALIDALARDRRVVTFDNAGVGASTGTTPSTIEQMARDAIAFLEALDLGAVDLLGFSIGSFVAQEIALIRPAVVRRVVLASSAPRGAAGMHGWAPEVIGAVGVPAPDPDGYLGVFFTRSATSRQAGVETLGRLTERRDERDEQTTWQTRQAQYDACADWASGSRPAAAGQRDRHARVRGQRRRRPDDPCRTSPTCSPA
jgi:pimeloyl-ACP methyl ester carboxylesterase